MSDSPSLHTPPEEAAIAASGDAPKKRRARPWHRILGIMAALPLLWVVLTGAVLNHTVDWKLDRIMVSHPWVLSAYGMTPQGQAMAAVVDGHEVIEWDGLILVDGRIAELGGRLLGAGSVGKELVVATDSHVMRLDVDGRVMEVMDEVSLPALPLTGMRADGGMLILENDEGWFRLSGDWLGFEKVAGAGDTQPLIAVTDESRLQALRSVWSRGGLPLTRILLDVHAGRFLGSFSKYFYDLVAVATVWLCVTGLILFFRKPRRGR